MRRRVVKHGEATLTMSLPAKWVKKLGIKPKTEIEVKEDGDNLIISAEKSQPTESAEIDIKDYKKTGFRNIVSYYRKGCDELKLNYDDPDYLKRIEQCLSEELLGFEIVKQGKNWCLIKDVSGTKKEEFDALFKRLWHIIHSITEICYECITRQDHALLESLETLDKRVNKFSNYCIRILVKRGYHNHKNIPLLYRILRALEELSDQYKYFCQIFVKRNIKADTKIIKLLAKINKNYEIFSRVFYKYEPQVLEELFKSNKEIFTLVDKLFTANIDKEQLHYILILNEKIRILLSSVIEYNAVLR